MEFLLVKHLTQNTAPKHETQNAQHKTQNESQTKK